MADYEFREIDFFCGCNALRSLEPKYRVPHHWPPVESMEYFARQREVMMNGFEVALKRFDHFKDRPLPTRTQT